MARSFYEFFAGGGMARAGLGPDWSCLFANDIDAKKAASYEANWGKGAMRVGDIAALTTADLPGRADLAWASFPCQDLSLAGNGAGLAGERSGTFWSFWSLMNALRLERRLPKIIALENVVGLLTSHGGKDFAEVTRALVTLGYRVGAMVIDAVHFVPQSRPRVFFVAARNDLSVDALRSADAPTPWCSPLSLLRAVDGLDARTRRQWRWWRLPAPPKRNVGLSDLIEDDPTGVAWHSKEQTAYILGMMSEVNRLKLLAAQAGKDRVIGTVYRRTRPDGRGGKTQRAEVRFDDVSGCLRTPAGGSSRQIIMVVEGQRVRTRLLSPREAARLMGLGDDYLLPEKYNEAYHLLGDGVVASVVGWLANAFDWAEPSAQSEAFWMDDRFFADNKRNEVQAVLTSKTSRNRLQIRIAQGVLQMKTKKISKPEILSLGDSILYEGDALTVLQRLPSDSVQCAVTSPPYWGLRDYDIPDQIGLEESLPQFVNRLRAIFNELRRVLKSDGVFWLNIGDGYTSGNRGWRAPDKKNPARAMDVRPVTPDGLKPKDLLGLPWR